MLSGTYAYAVTDNVRQACRSDYYQHCSRFSVGTEELRQCMRKVGQDLSTPCLVALVQAGEITPADVERHNAAKAGKTVSKTAATGAGLPAADDPKNVSSRSIANGKAAKASGSKNAKAATKAKNAKNTKKVTASAKPKPGSKAKTTKKASVAAHTGGASKNGTAGKNKNKKTASKQSSASPGAAKPAAVKKAKNVPAASAP